MKLSKREYILAGITAVVMVSAAVVMRMDNVSTGQSALDRDHAMRYEMIVDQVSDDTAFLQRIYDSPYYRTAHEDQVLAFQQYLEKTARDAGIRDIGALRPQEADRDTSGGQIAIRIDVSASAYALTRFMYNIAQGALPATVTDAKWYSNDANPKFIMAKMTIAMRWIAQRRPA